LILQDADGLNLSLYLDDDIVRNLHENNPLFQLHQDNLEDCCLALEGVSHFLYVIWNATYDRSITQLELELQAEVDKFITLSAFLSRQSHIFVVNDLQEVLFRNIKFDSRLNDEELHRYQLANRFAAKYCRQLQDRFIEKGNVSDLMKELRRFYRMRQDRKLYHINLFS